MSFSNPVVRGAVRAVAGAAAVTLAVASAACGQSPPKRRTLEVVGSGIIGDKNLAFLQHDSDWYPAAADPSVTQDPPQADACTPKTINKPLNAQQAAALQAFLAGAPVHRYYPLKKEHTLIDDKMVGWVCTPDRTILYSAQGQYLVLGKGSLDNSHPYGPDLRKLENPQDVALQGRIVAAVAPGDDSFAMVGMDGGRFNIPAGAHLLQTTSVELDLSEVTAVIVTKSGKAAAIIANVDGGRGGRSLEPVHAQERQRIVWSTTQTVPPRRPSC